MLVETTQIMTITQLQKTLTQTVRQIAKDKQPVFIMKNFPHLKNWKNIKKFFRWFKTG